MLKLATAPTFKRTVEIPIHDGQIAKIECTFKWMSLRDLGAFLARVRLAANAHRWPVRLSQFVIRGLSRVPGLQKWAKPRILTYRTDYDYLNDMIESWDGVDMPWSEEACKQLIALYPQAVTFILAAWAKGLEENRLGN